MDMYNVIFRTRYEIPV